MALKIRVFSTSIILLLVLATALAALVTSCAPAGGAGDKIGVAVSIVPLADFVENVGEDKVDVTVMVPPGAVTVRRRVALTSCLTLPGQS